MMKQGLVQTVVVLAVVLPLVSACVPQGVKQAIENQKPTVRVAEKKLTGLDFNKLDMGFTFEVNNPNPVAIALAGLDYELKLAGQRFVSGKQDQQLRMAASGSSHFTLPLTLSYKDIYQGIDRLKGKNEIPYELNTGLLIDVPLLGALRYPVKTKGVIPLPRLPKLALAGMKLKEIGLGGATLMLELSVDNPNAFGLMLDQLNYDLTVNGKRWVSGNSQALGTVMSKQQSTIALPISLNFMELGSGIYGLLQHGQGLDYRLNGRLNARSDHKLLGSFNMPFDSTGQVKVSR